MAIELKTGKFVNVVGAIDLADGSGKILYVNPATSAVAGDSAGHPDVELVIENAAGAELKRQHPVIRFSSCESGAAATQGLIQEDLEVVPGMKRIKLLYKGQEKSRFEAGSPPVAAAAAAGAAPHLAAVAGPDIHHTALKPSGAVAPEPGVTYSVQAQPAGGTAWQTIAVGSQTPDFKVDPNQFPGAQRLKVRVLRSTGFDETVLWQQDVDLSK